MATGDFGGYGGGGSWGDPLVRTTPSHYRLTIDGTFGAVTSPYEIWNVTMALPDNMPTTDLVAKIGAAVDEWHLQYKTFLGTDVWVAGATLAAIAEGGLYAKDASGGYLFNETVGRALQGTGTAVGGPPQVALAVSLQTDAVGPSGKGRFYLPGPSFVMGTGRRLTAADSQAVANSSASVIRNISTTFGAPVSVASTLGYVRPVTSVRVGRALDTIRSRRGKLLEEYAVTAL